MVEEYTECTTCIGRNQNSTSEIICISEIMMVVTPTEKFTRYKSLGVICDICYTFLLISMIMNKYLKFL
jgi:hypothetical protein